MPKTLTQEERNEIFEEELKKRIKASIVDDFIPYHNIKLSDEQIDAVAEEIISFELDDYMVKDALENIGII